jgi:divalent metal cation (Fe/Co/Zn/Cd) transporter
MAPVDLNALHKRALRLEYATIGWNVGEAVFTIAIGLAVGSLALISFGTDAIIEVFASSVVVWHLRPGREPATNRTFTALRLVAGAFFALALVLAIAAVRDLTSGRQAGESLLGIGYLAITAVVMFSLAVAKLRTADELASAPLRSEAMLTFLDGILATATLTGLALNAGPGWWWADPAAALVVAIVAANEGGRTWREAQEWRPEAEEAGPGDSA